VKSQMRMMTGIGTPISQSRHERMVSPIKKHFFNAGVAKEVPACARAPRMIMGAGWQRASGPDGQVAAQENLDRLRTMAARATGQHDEFILKFTTVTATRTREVLSQMPARQHGAVEPVCGNYYAPAIGIASGERVTGKIPVVVSSAC
jgi:hypothetical protein